MKKQPIYSIYREKKQEFSEKIDKLFKGAYSDKMNRTGDKLVTWTATGEPNWSYIPSAGKSSKTKEQFVSEIKNLAQKAAKTENKAESDAISRQVLTLRAEYLSDVAPNRKLLYQQD